MQTHSSFITLLTRILFVLSISLLTTNAALADHRHHHKAHQHKAYYAQERYSDDRYSDDHYGDYGQVISARPIYKRTVIEVPQESCHRETIAHEGHRRGGNSFAGTVVGGLVGGAIGHNLSHGRGGATAVGGLIGAAIGNDLSRGERVVSYRDQEVCGTHYRTEYENRLVGYDVSYRYNGRTYQTRTNNHPGDRIPVAVDVRTHYRD
jgi:uncharacterized protein YcfJ